MADARDDRVDPAHEPIDELPAREVGRTATRRRRGPRASIGDRVAVHDAGLGKAVEQRDLALDAVGQRAPVVLRASRSACRAPGPGSSRGRRPAPSAGSWRDRAHASVVHGGEQLGGAVGRAVVDDEHLEVAVRLRETARDRLVQGRGAAPRRDRERDARMREFMW